MRLSLFSLYYQPTLGTTALMTAVPLTPWAIGFAFSGQVLLHAPVKLSQYLSSLSCAAFAVSLLIVGFASGDSSVAIILTGAVFILSGIGQGAGFIALMKHMTGIVSRRYVANLSGVSTTAIEIKCGDIR